MILDNVYCITFAMLMIETRNFRHEFPVVLNQRLEADNFVCEVIDLIGYCCLPLLNCLALYYAAHVLVVS